MLKNKTTEKKTFYGKDGMEYFIEVNYGMLSSSCFSITSTLKLRTARNRWTIICEGLIENEIKEHFPHLEQLIFFHLHNQETGLPSHYFSDVLYFYRSKDWVNLNRIAHLPPNTVFFQELTSIKLVEYFSWKAELISTNFHNLMKKFYVEYNTNESSKS